MKERVLILDDEIHVVDILSQHLTMEGYECSATISPTEALRQLREDASERGLEFSVLLTDLKMPDMSGLEVVRAAKALDPDMAVIVVTGLFDIQKAIEAMRIGADDYVLKPFDISEISLSVKHAVERRTLILENRRHQQELEMRIKEATEGFEKANQELRTTKEYLENLINSTVDAIITSDNQGRVTFINHGGVRMLGYSQRQAVQLTMAGIYAGGNEEARHVRRLLREGAPLQNYETELKHKDESVIPVNMSISYVHDSEGASTAILAICKDITHQKQLERELKEMSIKDSLTGLYNQRFFYDRLASEIERTRRQKHPLSLLLFDIDQFKTYNDCHGHLAGDQVLQTAGQVVMESTREHVDLGFRYGGDEFTVILPEADEAQAYNIAERIRDSFESKKFDQLTVSIGLMTYKEGYSLRTFIQFTDAMMYDAKRSGGNRIFVFRPESRVEVAVQEEEPEA